MIWRFTGIVDKKGEQTRVTNALPQGTYNEKFESNPFFCEGDIIQGCDQTRQQGTLRTRLSEVRRSSRGLGTPVIHCSAILIAHRGS